MKIVEATVKVDGKRVPLGIMNAQQALDMPAEEGMKFSHPDGKPGETDVLLNREQLDKVVKDKASANKRKRPM
ncbi:hypothetical protein QA644_15575 [Rhizobium sp. CC1099]|uniref:hypothetical protein n=1 Tax=unclassified Rhizobium TaxID=2613769 RepID=UPI001FEE7208|nr:MULTISPECIES: hypothetical protein [unclassified Rhizobium]WFU86519.1 hypothetical protein QA644_15575 [Rhizobium sp. CC1099]